jgi:4-aminobutyrate aminotransferase-like enzyme/Ser/Thr protein kinase RdoA (MazF antagonist)
VSVLIHAPVLDSSEAADAARTLFGIAATAAPLPSERDQNFLLTTPAGDKYVLKIANGSDPATLLEAQNAALEQVAARTRLCPRVMRARDGRLISEVTSNGRRHFVRLLTWIDGEPLGTVATPSIDLEQDLGRAVGELDAALEGFDHPAIHRDFYWDLRGGVDRARAGAALVRDGDLRRLVESTLERIDRDESAHFARLPLGAVHNDPNDYNVLVSLAPGDRGAEGKGATVASPRTIAGILDFGDMVHTYAIADLAIAIAYAVLDAADPLATAVAVVRGYQRMRPVRDEEIEALFGLVLLRLCMSVAIAAHQQTHRPDDAYLSVSQAPIARTLPRLAALDPDAVEAAFRAARGKTPEETLEARRRVVGPNLSIAYREPLKIVRGWMQFLYDQSGRRYLDAYNNVPHVGHSHPRVVQAAIEQLLVLNTNTRYLHDSLALFAERLTSTLPDPLRVCYFVNSGSEANELALRLARAHTRRRDVVVLDHAYHGNTTTLIDISPYKFNGPGGEGAPPWVHVLPLPDTYRGKYRGDDPRAGEKYAEFARYVANPGAFIAESAPSVGGQIILPDRYLASVYAIVRAAGGVCIADEVQTAYGRMGTHFYAFEAQRVVPDIVVLGKPIGNGYPLGAVVTTREIAASFDNGMEFFSTFGGSTVSCAVGLAVLDVVQQERLQEHASEVGAALRARLRALGESHPVIGDVRGSGLFLGVELVKDRQTLEPAAAEASDVVNSLRARGVLVGTDGPFENVLKIRPPMPFTLEDADVLVRELDAALP